MKIVANGVNALRGPDRAMLVVTHYQRLLNYIVPDFVHVLVDGRIVRSGGKDLALELEAQGYAGIEAKPPSWPRPDRLLKKPHLRRSRAPAAPRRTAKYASRRVPIPMGAHPADGYPARRLASGPF